MEITMRILVVGNETSDTDSRAHEIARQYGVDYIGRLNPENCQKSGCGCVTILKNLSLDQWRLTADMADLIIVLDQPPESYSNIGSWEKAQTGPKWLSHFKAVTYENHKKDLYITKKFIPKRIFNSEIVQVANNQALVKEVYQHNLTGRRLILEFMQLQQQSVIELLSSIDLVIDHCRQSASKFVFFRADEHEPDPMHFQITRHLCQYPEFLLLKPSDFNDLDLTIRLHWNKLYKI